MAEKRIKRPRDPMQLAKLIGDIATGQIQDVVEDGKNPHAVALGKLRAPRAGRQEQRNLQRNSEKK